jgi:hypothetical protein
MLQVQPYRSHEYLNAIEYGSEVSTSCQAVSLRCCPELPLDLVPFLLAPGLLRNFLQSYPTCFEYTSVGKWGRRSAQLGVECDYEHVAPVENRMCGRTLDSLSDLCYRLLVSIEAYFVRCVRHVIRTCHAPLTSGRGSKGDGGTAAGLNLGAIPVGSAVCYRVAFRVHGRSESRRKPRG